MKAETAVKVIKNATTSATKIRKLEEENTYLRTALGLMQEEGERLTVKQIVKAVSKHTGIAQADILGECRVSAVVAARQYVFTLARREGFTPAHIARAMNRNHATVLYGIKTIEAVIADAMNIQGAAS